MAPGSIHVRHFSRAGQQRLLDAEFLLTVKRTTGAVYLAGYCVECMLKALILAETPIEQEQAVLARFRGRVGHDYESLKEQYETRSGRRLPRHITPDFAAVNEWATEMRYKPGTTNMKQSRAFLAAARRITQWARTRL